ncbi:MAG: o-succinylbenzoate synthase [Candidatus Hydrogenedentota bacterium]
MSPVHVRFYRYKLPLVRPLVLKDKAITQREGCIVAVETDAGVTGYGDIAPLYGFSRERLEDAVGAVREQINVLKRRAQPDSFRAFDGLRYRDKVPPSARFGLESALLDLAAKLRKQQPCEVLSADPQSRPRICALLNGHREETVAQALDSASRGFAAVKLKVGRAPYLEDIATVRAVREVLPESVAIRIDANRAWPLETAVQVAGAVADCGVAYIEEPVNRVEDLREFARKSPVPLAVDETLQEAGWHRFLEWQPSLRRGSAEAGAEGPHLAAALAARVWVIKPTLTGIPIGYLARVLRDPEFDAKIVLSSSFESRIGWVALANVAACSESRGLPAGLDTASWFRSDLLHAPLPIVNGLVDLAAANANAALFDPTGWEEFVPDD